jgi:hypothetical protein
MSIYKRVMEGDGGRSIHIQEDYGRGWRLWLSIYKRVNLAITLQDLLSIDSLLSFLVPREEGKALGSWRLPLYPYTRVLKQP